MNPWTDLNGAFGHPFARSAMSQSFSALYWIGRLLEVHPELQSCLELGTLNGAMTSFLGMNFPDTTVTCDIRDSRSRATKELHRKLGIHFHEIDLLTPEAPRLLLLEQYAHPKPLVLFCDNGNKEKEFVSFVPLLESGDVVIVHDLYSEFIPSKKEIIECIISEKLISWNPAALDYDFTHLGVWIKS